MRGSARFMESYKERPKELDEPSGERWERALDEHLAPALHESVVRYAKTVVADLEHDLDTWKRVAAARPGRAGPPGASLRHR